MRTVDTKILEKLSKRVERLCQDINNPDAAAMGKDWSWAELTHDALPELETYLNHQETRFSVETILRTKIALKNDAAGNRKCTMTDLDLACDMLDELLKILKK